MNYSQNGYPTAVSATTREAGSVDTSDNLSQLSTSAIIWSRYSVS